MSKRCASGLLPLGGRESAGQDGEGRARTRLGGDSVGTLGQHDAVDLHAEQLKTLAARVPCHCKTDWPSLSSTLLPGRGSYTGKEN